MTSRPAPTRTATGRLGRLRRPATRRGRITRAVVLPVAALLALAGVGEAVARHVLEGRIADGMGRALDTRVTVDTGDGPALLTILDRHLGHVTLSGANARLGPLTGASVRITLDGVHLAKPATASDVRATVTIPTDSLAEAIRDSGQGVPVNSARADPATGTLLLTLGPGGMGQLTLKPALTDGRVTITATSLRFLDRTITGPQLDQINSRLTARNQPAAYPLSLKPVSLTVTPTGLALTLASGHTTLEQP
ncbi:DUF2993 domain-containing protein [Kitasatospora sp. NBC_01287]|uniref:LmeA family phospholipid-binding protein n=1 Tax=Kitasatospora sp. NBC_01287 TaxID=2903573 RepID=UPI002254C0BA|nr:DUF2993 domain-containing protein [Kitasatospora sp. NBC_01287]MCX4744179.1 DUF2993 domain-containing protein [Kitasatospora sp. NBC_01287]